MNILKTILLFLTLTIIISCTEELQSALESDYKVIELVNGYNDYINNDNQKPFIIKERNLIKIEINEKGECIIENKYIEDSLIVSELKKYLVPNPKNNQMPITIEKEFKYSGKVIVTKNLLVAAIYDERLNYKTYREIRDKFYSALYEVRNEFSIKRFNKTLKELQNSDVEIDISKWEEIRRVFPFHYSEIVLK